MKASNKSTGKMSRDKGKRVEYLVRDELKANGWDAHRVPSSGSSQGFKGDIKASKDFTTYEFEVKARKNAFKRLYNALESLKTGHLGVWYQGIGIGLSYSLPDLLNNVLFMDSGETKIPDMYLRKMYSMSKLIGTSDVLVLKDNNMPLLYMRFILPHGTTGR